MRKFISSLLTMGLLAAVSAGPAVAMDKMHGAMHGTMMKSKCAAGSTWVHGYTNKATGKHVKGYCRKSAMMHKKM